MRLRFRPIENVTRPIHVLGRLYNWEKGFFERDEQHRLLVEEGEVWYDARLEFMTSALQGSCPPCFPFPLNVMLLY